MSHFLFPRLYCSYIAKWKKYNCCGYIAATDTNHRERDREQVTFNLFSCTPLQKIVLYKQNKCVADYESGRKHLIQTQLYICINISRIWVSPSITRQKWCCEIQNPYLYILLSHIEIVFSLCEALAKSLIWMKLNQMNVCNLSRKDSKRFFFKICIKKKKL